MAPATVENGPRGVAGRSHHKSVSHPWTRAHSGTADSPAATATTTVYGAYHRAVGRLRTSEAMVSITMPPASRMTTGNSARQATWGVAMRAGGIGGQDGRDQPDHRPAPCS